MHAPPPRGVDSRAISDRLMQSARTHRRCVGGHSHTQVHCTTTVQITHDRSTSLNPHASPLARTHTRTHAHRPTHARTHTHIQRVCTARHRRLDFRRRSRSAPVRAKVNRTNRRSKRMETYRTPETIRKQHHHHRHRHHRRRRRRGAFIQPDSKKRQIQVQKRDIERSIEGGCERASILPSYSDTRVCVCFLFVILLLSSLVYRL